MTEKPHTDIFAFLDHPAVHAPLTVGIVGVAVWTVVVWGFTRERWKGQFWHQYKDEFWASVVGMLVFVAYDSQIAWIIDVVLERAMGTEVDTPLEFGAGHYLVSGPITELLYGWGKRMYLKFNRHEPKPTENE